ncbi:hypothetical protein [Frisingicoccus sp.]
MLNDSDKLLEQSIKNKQDADATLEKADKLTEAAKQQVASMEQECKRQLEASKNWIEEVLEETSKAIKEVETRCEKDNQEALKAREKAEEYKEAYYELFNNEKYKISDEAERQIRDHKEYLTQEAKSNQKKLEAEYQNHKKKTKQYYQSKYLKMEVVHEMVFAFTILWTVIQAILSNRILSDGGKIIESITQYLKTTYASIGLWTLLYLILAIAIVIGCIAYFGSKYFDKPNRWIMTATTIVIIAVSSEMTFQPRYNVILTWLVIQALVPAIRYLIIPFIGSFCEEWKYMDTEKQQDYGIVVTGIAVIVGFGMLLIAINPLIIIAIPIAALIVMIKF